jgi:fructan beta-fructosidase
LFADNGLSVMTEIFFPSKQYNQISIQSSTGATIKKLEYASLNKIDLALIVSNRNNEVAT